MTYSYRTPSELEKMFRKSHSTIYRMIDFIKLNTGKGKRYPAETSIIQGSSGQLINLNVYFDAFRWRKAIEMGVAPAYDSRCAENYELYLGGT